MEFCLGPRCCRRRLARMVAGAELNVEPSYEMFRLLFARPARCLRAAPCRGRDLHPNHDRHHRGLRRRLPRRALRGTELSKGGLVRPVDSGGMVKELIWSDLRDLAR